jgi:hypothetical protein
MTTRKVDSISMGLLGVSETANIYWNPEYREYTVKFEGHPNADYFTDDRDDARDTAIAELKRMLEASAAKCRVNKRGWMRRSSTKSSI